MRFGRAPRYQEPNDWGPWLAGGFRNRYARDLRPLAAGSARRNFFLAPQAAAGTPRIAMGPCPGCPWAPKKRSKPKESMQ